MSTTGYVIWFIATTIMTVCVMGLGVAAAAGVFRKEEPHSPSGADSRRLEVAPDDHSDDRDHHHHAA